jgi:hypothetical protein
LETGWTIFDAKDVHLCKANNHNSDFQEHFNIFQKNCQNKTLTTGFSRIKNLNVMKIRLEIPAKTVQ